MRCLPLSLSLVARVLAPLIGSLFALALSRAPSQAAQRTFVLADMAGYGISDCIATKASCGKMAADAWCSAHGSRRATAFGSAKDVTGSIGGLQNVAADSVIVACGD